MAAYMEPWHSQIFKFLETKLPENHERCPGIFTGLFVPELFFKLFRDTPWSDWYLFDPKDAGDLERLYGEEFEREYYRLVTAGKFCGRVSIKSLMFSIVNCAVKAGSPFILLKEACNAHFWRDLQGEAMNAANLCAEGLQEAGQCGGLHGALAQPDFQVFGNEAAGEPREVPGHLYGALCPRALLQAF